MTTHNHMYHSMQIVKYEKGDLRPNITANLVPETGLTVMLNQNYLTTLVCSPQAYEQLAVGYLLSSGLINNYTDITGLTLDQKQRHVHIQTTPPPPGATSNHVGCGADQVISALGLKKVDYPTRFSAPKLLELIDKLNAGSAVFRLTGGVHSAGLSDQSQILFTYEDMGRHNAVDKVAGHATMQSIDPADKCLLLTCRVASEILIKAARLQVPLVLSRSAPTLLAVELARALQITLIGFARGNSMNIYCHDYRVSP